jgi:hypothetical protein
MRFAFGCAVAVALALCSCDRVLSLEEYRTSGGAGGTAGEDAASVQGTGGQGGQASDALDDALTCGEIRLSGEQCEACVAGGACTAMTDACNADPTCPAFSACLADCGNFAGDPDPGCYLECQLAHCADCPAMAGGIAYPPWTTPFVHSGCAYGECRIGEQWGCVERNWQWPTPPLGQVATIRLSWGIPPLSNFTAKLCDGSVIGGCGPEQTLIGPISVDDSGIVELQVPLDGVLPSLFGTQRYFELQSAETGVTLYYPGHPLVGDQYFPIPSVDTATGSALFEQARVTLDPSKGIVVLMPLFDCTGGANPEGVEIIGPDGTSPLYGGPVSQGGTIDPERTYTAPEFSTVYLPNVDPGIVTIRARAQEQYGRKEVAAASVEVRAGAVTMLTLYPSASL